MTEAEYEAAYAKWERQYDEWAAQARSRFTTLPDTNAAIARALCEPLEILFKKGVLDPNTVPSGMWMQALPEAAAEEWVKAAFGSAGSGASAQPAPAAPAFTDVPSDAYYAEAVKWAVERSITGGTGDGNFSPSATCTRGQIVTFLFRAMGK